MIITDETVRFIQLHRLEDVRALALKGCKDETVDMPFALDQIQGWQTARTKLPTWAATEGIIYPPHLNMEQCSSEETARYKRECLTWLCNISEATLIDLTGGFGVDFSMMSRKFRHAVYVERNAQLVEVAKHNFDMLDLQNVEAVNGDGVEYLHQLASEMQLSASYKGSDEAEANRKIIIFLDPARRDVHGKKVFRLEDCTPDVLGIRDELLQCADVVMIKLSPMLDWHEAVKQLTANLPSERNNVHCEVHVISVKNECKELLIILRPQTSDDVHQPVDADNHQIKLICINDNQRFETEISKDTQQEPLLLDRVLGDEAGHYLFVPNASIMKAGVFAQLSHTYGIPMLDQDTHYYIGDHDVENFPGRRFHILAVSSMNKKELKRKLVGITQANIATRNFPLSAVELRKRLKLKDGGDNYLFVTTVQGNHVVFICQNVKLSL